MVDCAYCENPLIFDTYRANYTPPNQESYQALSESDVLLTCTECGAVLVCHWCKTPYDGLSENATGATGSQRVEGAG